MSIIIAALIASLIWFILAGILFFNPVVDKIYSSEKEHPSVKKLPKTPKTMLSIITAILIQSFLWAYVFMIIGPGLPGATKLTRGVFFGLILILLKIIPRDIDRWLLSTYPQKRMTIEFIVGSICSLVIGIIFAYTI